MSYLPKVRIRKKAYSPQADWVERETGAERRLISQHRPRAAVRCSRCGRPVSERESVIAGMGPVCRQSIGRAMHHPDRSKGLKIANATGRSSEARITLEDDFVLVDCNGYSASPIEDLKAAISAARDAGIPDHSKPFLYRDGFGDLSLLMISDHESIHFERLPCADLGAAIEWVRTNSDSCQAPHRP